MVPVPGSEKVVDANLVLIAAGFTGSQKYVTDAFGVSVDARTNVATKEETYETNVPGYLQQEMCAEVSRWSYGRSRKENRLQKQSIIL